MKKLVVIGGGFAGSKIAKALENDFDVTLIDSKDYFEYTPGVLEAIVDPECMKAIRVMHTSYLKKAMVVTGEVKKVSEKEVFVSNKRIPFDYLVIASGSSYSYPFSGHDAVTTGRANELRGHCNDLFKAKKVLVIGGGFTGVELASDIVCKYPEKEITLIHAVDRLLERQPKEVCDYAKRFLEKRGVKIIFNELVKQEKSGMYETNKGTKVKADIAFLCVGITPNSRFMKANFSRSLDKRSHILVNNFLEMENRKNIFVAGDVTAIKEEKTAQSALEHADVIIENIRKLENKKPLKEYKFRNKGMLISLGPKKGIFSRGNFVLRGRLPRIMKSYVQKKQMMSM